MNTISKMTGFKATDANMRCRGFQYELGKWYEFTGELKMCVSGFHFCVHPSGPWSFYNDAGTRIFAVEAEEILVTPYEAGAELKKVCCRIRLVREIAFEGYSNTGDSNTGYRNTGYRNTGSGCATNYSADFFAIAEPKVKSFGVQTQLTAEQFRNKHPVYWDLCELLHAPEAIDFARFKSIPGITKAKLLALHKKHLAAKSAQPITE